MDELVEATVREAPSSNPIQSADPLIGMVATLFTDARSVGPNTAKSEARRKGNDQLLRETVAQYRGDANVSTRTRTPPANSNLGHLSSDMTGGGDVMRATARGTFLNKVGAISKHGPPLQARKANDNNNSGGIWDRREQETLLERSNDAIRAQAREALQYTILDPPADRVKMQRIKDGLMAQAKGHSGSLTRSQVKTLYSELMGCSADAIPVKTNEPNPNPNPNPN